MLKFSHTIKVRTLDIDELGHVNNVVYVRYVQEAAAAHWQSIANASLQSKYKWVVLRHEIDYKSPAYAGETLLITTWVGAHHGVKFERFVEIISDKSKKIVAQAKTIWCILDAVSMRPVRVGDDVLKLFTQ